MHVGGVISFLRRKELAIFVVGVLERTKVWDYSWRKVILISLELLPFCWMAIIRPAIKRKSNFDVDFVSSNEKNATLHPFPIFIWTWKKLEFKDNRDNSYFAFLLLAYFMSQHHAHAVNQARRLGENKMQEYGLEPVALTSLPILLF